jgi:hypothetical protein
MVVPRIRGVSQSRSTGPRRAALPTATLAAVALLLGGPVGVPALAADPAGDADTASARAGDPLGGPFVDVAFVAGGSVAAGRSVQAPRILAVRPPDPHEPGTIHLALLVRDAVRWSVAGTLDVPTGLAVAGAGWLVPLGGSFGLLSVDADAGQTSVVILEPGVASIRQVGAATIPLVANRAGSADVDGDGSAELILARSPSEPSDGACPGTRLVVLDGRAGTIRHEATVVGLGLDGGAVGRLGGRGMGLVAYGTRSCGGGPASPWPEEIVVVDLGSGRTTAQLDLQQAPASLATVGPRIPLLVDLDGDGIDEAVVRDGSATVVLDPARDWRREVILEGGIPLAITGGADRPRLLAAYEPGDRLGRGPRIELLALGRLRAGGAAVHRALAAIPVSVDPAGATTVPAIAAVTDPAAPPPDWAGDLGGEGCPALLLPRATFLRCGVAGDPDRWTSRAGPGWAATTPLAAYGERGSRRLLVASGLDWSASSGGVVAPAPAAATSVAGAGWRSGPTGSFALEELDAGDVSYFTVFPVPAIDIDPTAGGLDNPEVIVGGTAGDRIFVRIRAEGPVAPDADVAPGAPATVAPAMGTPAAVAPDFAAAMAFLADPPPVGFGFARLIPVPAGSTAGANPGAARLPLPPAAPTIDGVASPGETGALPAGWSVGAVAVNAYGEISRVAQGRVEIDRVGPNVVVDVPLLSAPWPFSAPIRGVAEPRARLRLGDGPVVDAAMNGAFELRAQLAPWPQALVIHAVDERGNETVRILSVVGGLDYRRLPWQTILIAGTLLGAAITTWRGPGPLARRLEAATVLPASRSIGAGREEVAEIEDLPSEPRPPRR